MPKTKPKTSGYVCIGGTCGRSDLGADEVINCFQCKDLVCIDCAHDAVLYGFSNGFWCKDCYLRYIDEEIGVKINNAL